MERVYWREKATVPRENPATGKMESFGGGSLKRVAEHWGVSVQCAWYWRNRPQHKEWLAARDKALLAP